MFAFFVPPLVRKSPEIMQGRNTALLSTAKEFSHQKMQALFVITSHPEPEKEILWPFVKRVSPPVAETDPHKSCLTSLSLLWQEIA